MFVRLEKSAASLQGGVPRILFHSSSMGEFEQAKPIIAELKRRHPKSQIIVSFFSPSGFEHSRNYKLADVITYLPFDSALNARRFIDIIRPTAAVMVRYDVWPNHLWEMKRAGVPLFIANATLRERTVRALPGARQFHRAVYNAIDYILTVSDTDKRSFEKFRLTHPVLETVGDTRYDQVWQRSQDSKQRHILPAGIIRNKNIVVVGSSWQDDEEVLLPALVKLAGENQDLLIVLVPHEPTEENLERIENELNGQMPCIRLSNLTDYQGQKTVLVDSIGVLMPLYQYAQAAYVGGSFRQGVHNVLEPAAYGVPIVTGPEIENSQEALQLVREGAAFVGKTPQDLHRHLAALLTDPNKREEAGKKAVEFVQRNVGATGRFLSYLEKVL